MGAFIPHIVSGVGEDVEVTPHVGGVRELEVKDPELQIERAQDAGI